MQVQQWMNPKPATVAPGDTLATAASLMVRRDIRRLLVVDQDRLCGILARSDVLRAAPAGSTPFSSLGVPEHALDMPVRDAMSTAVTFVAPDLPIEDAARVMMEEKIGILPVLSGPLTVGVLTRSDLFNAFIAMLGEGQDGLRVSFDITETEDAVAFVVALARKNKMQVASVSTFARDGRRSAVVRLAGHEPPGMIDELWKTGHRVLSVNRPPGPPRPKRP